MPEQAQVTRALTRQLHLTLIDTLVGKTQAGNLPLAPTAPVLQVVTGFDGEALKALLGTAPAQIEAHQRRLDGTGVEQPATQLALRRAGLVVGQFDQRAIGAALHAQAGHATLLRIGIQRKPAHAVLLLLVARLAPARQQCIGLRLPLRIEDAHVSQIAMPCGVMHRHGQFYPVPGPDALDGQRHVLPVVLLTLLGLHAVDQRQAQSQQGNDDPHDNDSLFGTASSAWRGGSGAK